MNGFVLNKKCNEISPKKISAVDFKNKSKYLPHVTASQEQPYTNAGPIVRGQSSTKEKKSFYLA